MSEPQSTADHLTGAQSLVRSLEEVGADVVFGIPGGAILPAYDLGVVLRDWSGHVEAPGGRARLEGWCELLAARSGVDATRIWEWAFLERVSSGLYILAIGAPRAGAPFLRAAELLL